MDNFYSEDFAYCHHVGFSNPRLPDAVIGALRENSIADGLIIDLVCNGGHLIAGLAQSGYATIGIDLSAAALALTENLAPTATLYHSDVAEFALPRCAAIAALGEVLCYTSEAGTDTLADDDFLQSSFTALSPGGVLLFDIVIRDNANPFHYRRRHTGKDWRIDQTVSENLRTRRLRRDIVLDQHIDGSWRRSRETHWLKLHCESGLIARLRQIGFETAGSNRIGDVAMLPRQTALSAGNQRAKTLPTNSDETGSFRTMRYLHTMVRVKDLDKALDFYCSKLGMVETRRTESEKGRYTNLFLAASEDKANAEASKAPVLELTYNWDTEDYAGGRNFGHLAFEVDDIYQLCADLQASGVTINRPPRDGYMAFIRSPDGISIELLQKGGAKEAAEPWQSMENTGAW